MGRHRSSRSRGEERFRRKRRRTSSSASEESEERQVHHRVQALEAMVTQLRGQLAERSNYHARDIRQGDELLIPVFDPSKPEARIEQWIKRVDMLAQQYSWDERSVLRLIITRIKGRARQWYDSKELATSTWAETKAELLQQFQKPLPFGKLIEEAVLYQPTNGQDLGEYCFQKMEKWSKVKVKIPDEYLIDFVIEGVKNDTIARTLRAAQITESNKLFNAMTKMGKMPERRDVQKASVFTKNNTKGELR